MGQSIAPFYSILDALNSFEHFGRTPVYDEPIELAPGVAAAFINAGHILGSASIYLQLTEESQTSRLKSRGPSSGS